MKPLAPAAVGGLVLAATLPPWSLWWLAPAGYALLLVALLADGSRKAQFGRALVFHLAFFAVGMAWSLEFANAGFVGMIVAEALILAVPVLLLPRPPRLALLAFPAIVVVGEMVRYRFPLGGMPMSSPVLGQAEGVLLPLARVGGDFFILFVTALAGVAVFGVRRHRGLSVGIAVVGAAVAGASLLVDAPRAVSPLRVAYVQGGGPRGLNNLENETDAYANQVEATAKLRDPVDLVVWPEDVLDLPGTLAEDPVRTEVAALAKQLDATLVAGVVESAGPTRFRNAAVAWDRSGKIVDRYDKVHRVPFGEFVPARSLVSKVADISAVPRDAIAGKGDGVMLTRAGQLGVLISFEVFHPYRARISVNAGAELLVVPTNASSFEGSQVPKQQIAAAKLRAVGTGRDLVQAGPTGHSLFVDATGEVSDLSRLSAAAAATETLHLRRGRTPFARFGDYPMAALAIVALVGAWLLDRSVKGSD